MTFLGKFGLVNVTFNLANGIYRPYRKTNESLLYINTSSNHPPQVIKPLPTSISEQLSNNSSSEEIFNALKYESEIALKSSSYHQTKLIFNKTGHRKQKRNRNRNIIWFNPPFSRNVTTNVAKRFLNLLIDIHFPKSNKRYKIFNRNNVKVCYCCADILLSIIKTYNKKVTYAKITPRDQCNSKPRTTAYLMVTTKRVILCINALPQPQLIQTKYAKEQLKETSKKIL